MVSKCDVFYSKYKAGNAFTVARVKGKWSTAFVRRSFESRLYADLHYFQIILEFLSDFLFSLFVTEMTTDCYTTVAEICPYKDANSHCPRCHHTSNI